MGPKLLRFEGSSNGTQADIKCADTWPASWGRSQFCKAKIEEIQLIMKIRLIRNGWSWPQSPSVNFVVVFVGIFVGFLMVFFDDVIDTVMLSIVVIIIIIIICNIPRERLYDLDFDL